MTGLVERNGHRKDADARILSERDKTDDALDYLPQKEAEAQPIILNQGKIAKDIDSTQDVETKSEERQSEKISRIMTYSNTQFYKLMPSGAGQLWREHSMSPPTSTPSNSKPRHTGNPQTGESTCTTQTSRRCHPLCFARPSFYQTYVASLGDEARPLSKDKRSVPLSSIITERHPYSLGYESCFDDSDSDEEDDEIM